MTVISNDYQRVYAAAMILRRALKGSDENEQRVALDSFKREVEAAAPKPVAVIDPKWLDAQPGKVVLVDSIPPKMEPIAQPQDVPLSVVNIDPPTIPDDEHEDNEDVAGDTDAELMARAGVQHVHLADAD